MNVTLYEYQCPKCRGYFRFKYKEDRNCKKCNVGLLYFRPVISLEGAACTRNSV